MKMARLDSQQKSKMASGALLHASRDTARYHREGTQTNKQRGSRPSKKNWILPKTRVLVYKKARIEHTANNATHSR